MEHDILLGNSNKKNNMNSISKDDDDGFDLDDVIDEIGVEDLLGNTERRPANKPAAQNHNTINSTTNNNNTNNRDGNQDSNSFDLDNSDELNKFISKYEESNMLGEHPSGSKKGSGSVLSNKKSNESGSRKQLSALKNLNEKSTGELEESWSSLQQQAEQMLGADFDQENQSSDPRSNSRTDNSLSTANASQYVDPKIVEDEIQLSEKMNSGSET